MSYHLNVVVVELDKIISELDDSNTIDNNEIVNLLTNLIFDHRVVLKVLSMTFCDFKKTIRLNEFERFKALIYSFNIKLQKLYKNYSLLKASKKLIKNIIFKFFDLWYFFDNFFNA